MDKLKNSIIDKINENKPKLNKKSVIAYSIMLAQIYKNVFKDIENPDLDYFYNYKDVLKYLIQKYEPSQRKTYLASLLTVAPEVKEYSKNMLDDIKIYNDIQNNQEYNDKELKNILTKDEINEKVEFYKQIFIKNIHKDPSELSVKLIQDIQNYVLLCCCTGLYIPVRRSIDWCDMMLVPDDESTDNYLDYANDKFIFNKYKTSKTYKRQEIIIPKPLLKILGDFCILSLLKTKHKYLFFDDTYKPLSNVKLNYRFNKIFNKRHISINQFRHLFISDKIGTGINGFSIKELMEDSKNMGHSLQTHLLYAKK